MRALFVHDHTFTKTPTGAHYSPGKLPYRSWGRYLEVFEHLDVVGRVAGGLETRREDMDMASGPNVTIHGAPPGLLARRRFLRDLVDSVDAVIARLPSRLGLLAGHAALRTGTALAVEVVGCARDAYRFHGSLLAKAYSPVAWWRTRRLVARSPFALYVTDAYLQRLYPSPGVTANASNVVLPIPSKTVLAARLNKVRTAPTSLGMVGGLGARYKGWAVAIQALATLRTRYPRLELRILGSGDPEPWRREAHRYGVDAAIHFDGVLPSGAPVFDWLDQRDIFLLPSQTEGLPRALLEAMGRGLPAVASEVSDVPALLDRRFLHSPASSSELANVLTPLLESAELRAEAAQLNHRRAGDFAEQILGARRRAFWEEFGVFAAGATNRL